MNRLYVIESTPSNTGAMADHRLALRASEMEGFARQVVEQMGGMGAAGASAPANIPGDWIPALVRDLQQRNGSSIVIASDQQPPVVHALAHAMNQALGNVGKTVIYTDPIEANPVNQMQSLRDLVNDIWAGSVDTLIIIGGNPLYNAPADLELRSLFFPPAPEPDAPHPPSKVRLKIHLGLYHNETSELCDWHIPESHYLESWGDARAYDGTVSIIQPLISPLYQSKSAHELLAVLLGEPGSSAHDIVHDYWQRQKPGKDFEVFWQTTLHDGVMAGFCAFPKGRVTQIRFHGAILRARFTGWRGQHGTRHPPRPNHLGWPVCQQRLAPGDAQAQYEISPGITLP